MEKIKTAVIPVAGLGTRLLPLTLSVMKPMLPVGRKPAVQYVVEEMLSSGLQQIIFITGREEQTIKDHFAPDAEFLKRIDDKGSWRRYYLRTNDAKFLFVRQRIPRGSGHAVLQARKAVGNEAFVLALGDSIITNGDVLVKKMIQVQHERDAAAVIAVRQEPDEMLGNYGVVVPESVEKEGVLDIRGLVEKPAPGKAPSNLAVTARYILTPEIFSAIEQTRPRGTGEWQLSDAIVKLIKDGKRVCAVVMNAKQERLDIGNFSGYYKAFTHFALQDKKCGEELRRFLTQIL